MYINSSSLRLWFKTHHLKIIQPRFHYVKNGNPLTRLPLWAMGSDSYVFPLHLKKRQKGGKNSSPLPSKSNYTGFRHRIISQTNLNL